MGWVALGRCAGGGGRLSSILSLSLTSLASSIIFTSLCILTLAFTLVTLARAEDIFEEGKSDKEILDNLLLSTRYDKRLLPPVQDADFCCGMRWPGDTTGLTNRSSTFSNDPKNQNNNHYTPHQYLRTHLRGTLTVNVSVLLLSLASPDESSLKYEVEFLLQQQWYDPRLRYSNRSRYEFLNAIHHYEDIWLPDTYFIMHGDFKDPIIPVHFALRIYRNGTVNYLMRRHLILSCQGRLNIFPFDDPLCSFAIESISYEQTAITYVWKNDEGTLRKSPSLTSLNAYLIKNQTITCPIKVSWRERFQDPEPAESWTGVRDASQFGNISLQINLLTHTLIGSEDCLYLNVFTADVDTKKKRAVMMWLHGGSYIYGFGDDLMHGPDYIVRKDVVLVTLNYRLGALGFLNLQNDIAKGNQGLKDAMMALQWIHDNISNFGGDPENITLFGASAGAAIVHSLAMYPLADGLYHKIIMQSGAMLCPWAFNMPKWQKVFELVEKLGKRTTDLKEAGEFLQTADAEQIVAASKELLTTKEVRKFLITFSPSCDFNSLNPFFPEEDLFTKVHRGIKVPVLLGYTSNEGNYFTRNLKDNVIQLANSNFENVVPPSIIDDLKRKLLTVDDLRYFYFGNKPLSKETISNYSDYITDVIFCRPIHEVANIQMQLGHKSTYLYKFSYDNKASFLKIMFDITIPGVSHVEDIFYLFYPYLMKQSGILPPAPNSEDYKVMDRFTQMWTDFAKTGNPTPAVTDLIPIIWKPLETGDVYDYLNIDKELQMKAARKGEQRWNWEKIKSKL